MKKSTFHLKHVPSDNGCIYHCQLYVDNRGMLYEFVVWSFYVREPSGRDPESHLAIIYVFSTSRHTRACVMYRYVLHFITRVVLLLL